jgi:hypothetical protein
MSGLKDHDCKARMEARQGREGVTRQQNNQTTVYSLLQSIWWADMDLLRKTISLRWPLN